MADKKLLSGNQAVALAVEQVVPEMIVSAPLVQTGDILHFLAQRKAEGELDSDILDMESQSSSIFAAIGASVAGGRVFLCSGGEGLLQMNEGIVRASEWRLPLVMAVVSMTLYPLNASFPDHSDSQLTGNSGWIQLHSENTQEVYDNILQGFMIAEKTSFPVMVCQDSILTSDSEQITDVATGEDVHEFLGDYRPNYSVLDLQDPPVVGASQTRASHFSIRKHQFHVFRETLKAIKQSGREFGDMFNRYYGLFDTCSVDKAETVVVVAGSLAGTVREAADRITVKTGNKVGVLKIRVYRPFPADEIKDSLQHVKKVIVIERSLIPGKPAGPVSREIRSALYDLENRPVVLSLVCGIGGTGVLLEPFIQKLETMIDSGTEISDSAPFFLGEGIE